jgi:glycosyltransferase involved in cell wall biosynthesis
MPAYNEEASLEAVILDHLRVLEKLKGKISTWELVCVDDASRDRTPEILGELSQSEPRLRAVRLETNQGIFAAFARCYQEARGTHIYSTGSDGQWPTENLELMLDRLLAGADLVVGVRNNRREVYTVSRRIVSYAFNKLPHILFGVAVQDAGSVKLGLRDIFLFGLISKSPFSEAERLIKAARLGYKIDFVPIRFGIRSGGRATGSSWKNIRNSVRDMFHCVVVYGMR